MGSFCPKRNVSVRKFQKNCVMTQNSDAKFKGKLTRGLKNDIRNLVNFHASSRNSESLDFDGLLFPKDIKF